MNLFDIIKQKLGFSIDNERLHRYRAINTEIGRRGTQDSQQRAVYNRITPDYDLYSSIMDMRRMDREDGTIKQIHNRTAKALTKGGLILDNPTGDKKLDELWKNFQRRCDLKNRLKLISDAKGLIIEGSLPLQWVLNGTQDKIVKCVRLPAETIRPIVSVNGQFEDPNKAYAQYCYTEGRDIAFFPRWQLDLARLDPDNFDDMASLGRPMLDAVRKRWRQLDMTIDDMVLRRHVRAPQRMAHVLRGSDDKKLAAYKQQVESDEIAGLTNNYYMNTDGAVQAVEGDANLEQIADIGLIFDSFFSGTVMQKQLLGIDLNGLSRDVLDDMKKELYDELDTLQDSLSGVYQFGFDLEMLLNGINPEAVEHTVRYGERLTETLNQRTDRALKQKAVGASQHTVLTTAGLDPQAEKERIEREIEDGDVYPGDAPLPDVPTVKITPNNDRKGESATSISNNG